MGLVIARASGNVNTAEYQRYLNDAHDPVRADLTLRAQKVLVEATKLCPKHTGLLASTGRKSDGLEGEKPYTDITFGREGETKYLGYVLYGTPAHDIYPHNDRDNPHLRFVVGGAVIYAKKVHNPGVRANNFLEKALPAAASR
jgi:hypothetical protein